MASVATGVSLTLGLISTTVRVESAKEAETSLNQICQGQPNLPAHAPSALNQKLTCPACGPITDASLIKRGRPSGDGYLVVEPADIAALKTANADPFKKQITLSAHPRAQFELETARGEKLYYLVPDGTPDYYATMLEAVKTADAALCGLWTPRSVASLFQLRAYERDGMSALVLEERVSAASLKAVPTTGGTVIPALLAQAVQYIPLQVTPLDMTAYDDNFKIKLDELFGTVAVTAKLAAIGSTTAAVTTSPDDLIAQLKASIKAAPKKRAPRTPAARRSA